MNCSFSSCRSLTARTSTDRPPDERVRRTNSQLEREELRARDRIEDVGLDRNKSERLVQRLRRDHHGKRVQADARVAGLPRLLADSLGEPASELLAPGL